MGNYFPIKILVVTIEENTNICKCFNLKLKWEFKTSIEQTLDHDIHIKIMIKIFINKQVQENNLKSLNFKNNELLHYLSIQSTHT